MPDSVADATMDWRAVLHYRLTAQYAQLGVRERTAGSEGKFDWPHYVYFYVGRPHPDYGASVGIYRSPKDGTADWHVTPFDTGGLAQGRVVTHSALSDEDKLALISRWTRSDTTYVPEMDAWVGSAFDDYDGYIGTARPSHHLVTEIDLPKNSDHSWTWEGRLPALDYAAHPVTPLVVYLSEGRRAHFFEWLRHQRLVPRDNLAAYMQFIGTVVQQTESPVKAAQDTLSKGR